MAILSAGSIAATAADPASRLETLVMGLNDLAKETRARLTPGRPALTAWLALCVAAARAHGCDIIDGVYNDLSDLDGFRAECEQGRDMGLDGKTLIHPNQIDICNATFAPTATRDRGRARDHRRFRSAGKRRQGRHSAQRPHGRVAARADGAPNAGDRRRDRGAFPRRDLKPRCARSRGAVERGRANGYNPVPSLASQRSGAA